MFLALKHIALNFIYQYTVMPVNLSNVKICWIFIWDMLRGMQSFIFNNLISLGKKRLIIWSANGNFFYANSSIFFYPNINNSDNASLILMLGTNSFKELTFALNTCAFTEFMAITVNNKIAYVTANINKKKHLTMKFA